MLEDDDPATPGKVAGSWTGPSTATRDFHFLMVYARLRGPRPGALTPRVASALLALDRKLQGQEQRIKQSWNDRFAELAGLLIARDPRLTAALVRHPDFIAPGHVALALRLEGESRRRAARRFLEAATDDPDFPWSGSLIELFDALPVAETFPAYRRHWANYGLRDALLLELAGHPEAADRARFLDGLDSAQPQVVASAMAALDRLPRDPSPEHAVPLLRLLRRLAQQPKEARSRTRVLSLLSRQLGRTFDVREEEADAAALKRVYQAIVDEFAKEHPALAGALNAGAEVDLPAWRERLGRVDWGRGDAARGASLFQARGCQTCHAGPGALGPDLVGVTGRFARDDLFTAILAPSLDVSPLYQTTAIATRTGQVHAGMIAFESADGLIVQTGATTTVRIAEADIEDRQPSLRSLMPTGLLDGLKDDDLADLYQYLQTLGPRGDGNPRARR
jgi:putative heme-binding domain-containing protein